MDFHDSARPRLGQELGELAESEAALIKARVDLDHDLLEAIGTHDVLALAHPRQRLGQQLPRVNGLSDGVGRLPQSRQAGVRVILVAVLHEDVGTGLFDPDTDDVLPVLLELQDEARKVGVTREQDIGADLGSNKDELHSVDGHPDVGSVFFRAPVGGGEDEIDRGFGKRHDVLRVAAPIGVGPLHGDLAADDIRLEKGLQLLRQVTTHSQSDVVKVDQEGRVRSGGRDFTGPVHMGGLDVLIH